MKKLSFILALILILSICPTASAIEIPDGAYGVIWIPCLNIRMPIYTADQAHRQDVIDEEESALISHWGVAYDILDHFGSDGLDGKGQWNIQKVFPGAYAFYYTQDGHKYLYECYMTALTDYTGYDTEVLNGVYIAPHSAYDLMTVCCAGNDKHHHIVAVFHRVREY